MKYVEKDKAYKIVLRYGSYAASAKISDLPGIEIVRCKDCKHWGKPTEGVCYFTGFQKEGDFFCADGERSEE